MRSGGVPYRFASAVSSWFIPAEAVEGRARVGSGRGRRFTTANVWGLLFLADGRAAPWLDARDRRRLSGYLAREVLAALHPRLDGRGRLHAYRTHPGSLGRLRDEGRCMPTATTAAAKLRLGLVGGERFDAYVAAADLERIVARSALRASHEPNVLLRVVPDFGAPFPFADIAPLPAVALDLLEDPEPRARQVRHEILDRIAP